jgi:hypothetical protein
MELIDFLGPITRHLAERHVRESNRHQLGSLSNELSAFSENYLEVEVPIQHPDQTMQAFAPVPEWAGSKFKGP